MNKDNENIFPVVERTVLSSYEGDLDSLAEKALVREITKRTFNVIASIINDSEAIKAKEDKKEEAK
jgi:hypothetical protein